MEPVVVIEAKSKAPAGPDTVAEGIKLPPVTAVVVGVVVKLIWLAPAALRAEVLAPTEKLAVEPVLLVRLAKVKVSAAPVPPVNTFELMKLLPALSVRTFTVAPEAALALLVTLKVPPARVKAATSRRRLASLVVVLSSGRVAPLPTVS